jgi:hypothetical protein
MVSSIVPGTSGAGLAVDPRLTRPTTPGAQQANMQPANARGDTVEVSDAASWSAARESVDAGLAYVRETLAVARDAQTMLVQVQALLQNGGSQADLDALLQSYADRSDAAESDTAGLSAGNEISVFAEPGAPPVRVQGADLRLPGDLISIARDASIEDADLDAAVQRSLDAVQAEVERLNDASRSLEAHQGFLGAAEGALAANPALDADGARLLALQVRQGLANAGAIANVEPQAVLSLFKV